jgi:hypothetical protein
MAIKDKDRKARANYRKKLTVVRIELYGTDDDIKDHLQHVVDSGQTKSAYIKSLIREDIANNKPE